ncbi:hypothetical protein BDN72DRAFT_848118 [Pluteus cervinus]|uniref:Uncharacterized protein n=1 Tax=Pluteus cervinus TaxID=181527 RepID=A0ACD3ABF6_9AGAR|nr:hypothetical protein BDN72DRAFT_848118 [Pluteus cervinus]
MSINPDEEPSELARFRAEWRAEVERKKNAALPSSSTTTTHDSTSDPQQSGPSAVLAENPLTAYVKAGSKPATGSSSTVPKPNLNRDVSNAPPLSRATESALQVYRRAIHHEQCGELDEALTLYRAAFRMDPNIDRVYQREEMLASILAAQQNPINAASQPGHHRSESGGVVDVLVQQVASLSLGQGVNITGTLASVLSNFPQLLKFEPEDENEGLFISLIPDEIIIMVIWLLDPTSIERFGKVCRKTRVLTLDPTIWRRLVRTIYKPPQIECAEDLVTAANLFQNDYRRLFIEQPRVRLDGVYIAVCHYVRPGLSENHWVNISHLITYHRYLRFFPNGQVLSLLTNEEQSPQQVIPLLKPTLRMKGLYLGTWSLIGTTIHLSNLVEASGKYPIPDPIDGDLVVPFIPPPPLLLSQAPLAPLVYGYGHHHGAHGAHNNANNNATSDNLRYIFSMTLGLRARPKGRWNKLDIESYDSINLGTGDTTPVALKHERPFWFSKVRSYG